MKLIGVMGDTMMRSLINQSWTFTKSFSLQSDFLLHFDQVDTVSNVTLNQCYLGNRTN